jgi:Chlorophyll A-B binding protein
LEALGAELNPLVKYWDPLDLIDAGYWGFSQEQTIGWLRHSEIKHGRIAMFAFGTNCKECSMVPRKLSSPHLTFVHLWFSITG